MTEPHAAALGVAWTYYARDAEGIDLRRPATSLLAEIRRCGYYRSVSDIAEQDQAHRRFGAAYFTRLSLAEVRCFGQEQ
jgi:hypothetical protein